MTSFHLIIKEVGMKRLPEEQTDCIHVAKVDKFIVV